MVEWRDYFVRIAEHSSNCLSASKVYRRPWLWVNFIFLKVNDCRICGDPHSVLRFAFVEFANERKLIFTPWISFQTFLWKEIYYLILHAIWNVLETDSARAALNLGGTMVGSYPIKVLPSKTAILPVNPTFLPKVCCRLIPYMGTLIYFTQVFSYNLI